MQRDVGVSISNLFEVVMQLYTHSVLHSGGGGGIGGGGGAGRFACGLYFGQTPRPNFSQQWPGLVLLGGKGGPRNPRKLFGEGCGKGLRGPHACFLNPNA